MRRVIVNASRWLTWPAIAAVIGSLLFAAGWIRPYLAGPDLSHVTVYRSRPVPVPVETVRWLERERVRIKTERVPIEVIREVPRPVAERLERDWNLRLPELAAENKELLDILAVPKAPHGGEIAITANVETGTIAGVFRARRAPFLEVGGVRAAGVAFEARTGDTEAYYRQDLIRIGPAVVGGKAFVTSRGNYGALVGVEVRF